MENRVRLEGHVRAVRAFGYTARGVPMQGFSLCLHAARCEAPRDSLEHLRVLLAGRLAERHRGKLKAGARVVVEGRLRPGPDGALEVDALVAWWREEPVPMQLELVSGVV